MTYRISKQPEPTRLPQPDFQPTPAGPRPQRVTPTPQEKEARHARASGVMAFGTLLSRLTGVLRNAALLALGANILTDTYTVANNTPNIVYELLLGGVLSSTLVPVFVDLIGRRGSQSDDHTSDESWEGVSAIATMAGVAMFVISIALFLAAPALIRLFTWQNPDPLKREVATQLLRLFAPQIAGYGFISIATALLNARRRFAAPMFAPILNNLVVVGVLLWTNSRLNSFVRSSSGTERLAALQADKVTKWVLGLGTTGGVLVMALALIPSLRKANIAVRWTWQPTHVAVRQVLSLAGWTFGYVLANMAALVFVTIAVNQRETDPTAYSLAYGTFFLLPHGLLAVSIMTAIQPSLSRAFLDRRRGQFRRILHGGIRQIIVFVTPAAAGYLVLARPIVRLLPRSTGADLVADTLRMFAIGLPSFSVYLLLMNAAKAMRNSRLTYEINVIENCINILLAALLYRRYGVQGLAASFSIAYIIGAGIAYRSVGKRVAGLGGHRLLRCIRTVLLACVLMAIITWLTHRGLVSMLGSSPSYLRRVVQVGVPTVVGVTVYGVVGRALGLDELRALFSFVGRKLRS